MSAEGRQKGNSPAAQADGRKAEPKCGVAEEGEGPIVEWLIATIVVLAWVVYNRKRG